MNEETALVERARGGDREAFEELVRRTTRLVYARLYVETGDPDLSEDLVQETWMRAFRSIHQVSDPAGFRAWLLRIAHSVTIDSWRHAGRKRRAAPNRVGSEALDQAPAPEGDDAGRAEERERVRATLQGLPEPYRTVLTLRYINGSDYEAIAMQTGIQNGTLRGLLHRGLQHLKKAFQSEVSSL